MRHGGRIHLAYALELPKKIDEAQKESVNTSDIFKELHFDKSERQIKPLMEGKWD